MNININVQNLNFQFPKYNLVFFFYSTEDLWSRRKDRVWLSFFPDWNSRPDCGRDGFHQSDWGRTMNFLGQVANIWSGKILSFVNICRNWLRIYWIITDDISQNIKHIRQCVFLLRINVGEAESDNPLCVSIVVNITDICV